MDSAVVRKIIVPVDDQDRAIRFWTGQLGFELLTDQPDGDHRRIEVSPPDRSVVLVLSRRSVVESRPKVSPDLAQSPVFFECEDIERAYRELAARGVSFPAPPRPMPFRWWALFEDSDGTRYALGQR